MEPREPVQSWPDNGWPARRELELAQATVAATLPATPLVPLWLADEAARPIYMKLETLQPTGSFKVRGALAATAAYADVPGGIVTASAGNHGLGIAWAASRLGVQATIVVPETASAAKIEALRAFPSTLITYRQSKTISERAG